MMFHNRSPICLAITFIVTVGSMIYFMRMYSMEEMRHGLVKDQELMALKPYIKSYTKLIDIPEKKTNTVVQSYSQAGQEKAVFDILPIKNGFFVEIGAYDGKTFSNTLWLERKHDWTGLLIEANPELCSVIDELHRMAWRLCACISNEKQLTFIPKGAFGGVSQLMNEKVRAKMDTKHTVTVPCFRFKMVMDYLKRTRINYFSLDVEGAELFILETMKDALKSRDIIVDVWTIEYRVWDGTKKIVEDSLQNLENLRKYFRYIGGYVEHSHLSNDGQNQDGLALDVIFVNVQTWCKTRQVLPNGHKCR